jgi:DNA-binding NarL/FixJ family response regulator
VAVTDVTPARTGSGAATVGISDPLPVFRSGLREALARGSFVVKEPVDVVAWAAARDPGPGDGRMRPEDGAGRRAVLLSLTARRDWTVLDDLHDRCPDVVVVTLLAEPRTEAYRDAIARGALTAAPRASTSTHLLAVVRAAVAGRSLLPAAVLVSLAAPALDASVGLNDEERRWLVELANGTRIDDLACRTGYSRRTMYRRLGGVYRRLGADGRERALLAATRAGII